jgi:uncharacterized protein YjbI with pentapeptide repeats
MEEIPVTRPIPLDLLARIREHNRWLETFNEEGQQFAEDGIDLGDLDLSGYDLAWVALSDACLDRTLLYATDLSDASFYNCSFVQAVMDNAQLIETDATGCNFSAASLCRVQALSAEFYEANLSHANLTASNFYDADLQKTNLEGANCSSVNLRKASLRNARLVHATFTGAQVEGTTFIGATGIETVEVEWIDIGSEKAPQRLEGALAKKWLLNAAAGRAEWKITA